MIKLTVTLFLFFLFLSACQVLPAGLQDLTLQFLAGQVPGPLFQDDFTSTKSHWINEQDEHSVREYQEGAYRIRVNSPWMNAWSYPRGLSFNDVRIDVKAQRVAGEKDSVFGILCRYHDAANFYQLLVSSDGYYDISKVKNGQRIPLVGQQLLPSEAIPQDSDVMVLSAVCEGDRLVLFVNGTQIAQGVDRDFAAGNVGLLVGAFENAGVEMHFDDFLVWQP
jgi:hypothetical protein